MIYLLIAICSSSLISIVMRLSSTRVTGKYSMLAANYLTCTLIGGAFIGLGDLFPAAEGLSLTLGLGTVNGLLYLLALMLYQWSVAKSGVVLPSIFQRLGLLVPLVLSIVLFHEVPTLLQILGFCTAIAAIILINLQKDTAAKSRHFGGMLLLLLCTGMADAMSKIFEELGTSALSSQFLFYTFATALVLAICCIIAKKERPSLQDVFYGVLVGVPNYFTSRLILRSLTELPAVIVYPTYSVGTILVITLSGIFLFREKLTRRQWIALGAILAAVAMLNI